MKLRVSLPGCCWGYIVIISQKVAANRGAEGVDKISIKRFRSNAQLYLQELERDLRSGDFQPSPVKRVNIPKDAKKTRPLGIPNKSLTAIFHSPYQAG